MKYYNNAEEVINKIVNAFRTGKLPEALSQTFLSRGNFTCDNWSLMNKLIMALNDTHIAMGFKQWLEVGRCVRKGTHGFSILAPVTAKTKRKEDDGTEKEGRFVVGYRSVIVHPYENTEVVDEEKWGKVAAEMENCEEIIANLPYIEVAKQWGIEVSAYSGARSAALGWFCRNGKIGLGVANPATFAHELIHAADHKNGNLNEEGQHWASETVAELGGATLLYAAGYTTEADLGGAFKYIEAYAKRNKMDVVKACMQVLKRTGQAVQLVLDTAAETETVPA